MSHPSLRLICHLPSSWYLNYPVWLFKVGRKLRKMCSTTPPPPGNSVSASTASDRLLTTKPPSQPQCQKCRRCMLKGYRNQFNTHIVDSTYGTIGEHNYAILLANWTRLQFVARRHIQRFGLRRHIGNVYDSLLDDLKREIRLQRFGIIALDTTPPPPSATTTHLTFYRPSGGLL